MLEIKTYECDYFCKPFFPEQIQNHCRQNILTLEKVLTIGKEAEFQILIFGYDEFSGAKKFYESRVYTLADIQEKQFSRHQLD